MSSDGKTTVGWATRMIYHVRVLDVEDKDTIIMYGIDSLFEISRADWEKIGSPTFTEISIEGKDD